MNINMLIKPVRPTDAAAMLVARAQLLSHKGVPLGIEARPIFDEMFSTVPPAEGVILEATKLGGIEGYWCRPEKAHSGAVLLYIHGGGYVLGSALATTNLAGQIASKAGVAAFVPDYRLAPEHEFPAAINDVSAAYRAIVSTGADRILIAGDSAGGGLALSLLSMIAGEKSIGTQQPAAVAVMSPWTDLALTGASFETRAEADPIFARNVLKAFADSYLQGQDTHNPMASPLYAELDDMSPIRLDVGDDEVLLDDSIRYAERASAAGVDVTLAIWKGMPHVFQTSLGRLQAAGESLDEIGRFLKEHLAPRAPAGCAGG